MNYDNSAQLAAEAGGLTGNALLLHTTKFLVTADYPGFAEPALSEADLALLPMGSFFLTLKFTIANSYLSKDDEPWNTKNPIVRDWVSRVPYVRPTTWKGRLRFAAGQAGAEQKLINDLFGNEKGGKTVFQEGRLHFFPTFFRSAENVVVTEDEEKNREMINPHQRPNRIGTVPVTLGAVKPGMTGSFAVLYLADDEERSKEYAKLCCEWIADVLSVYGIGAKTLKGYGLARFSYKDVAFLPVKAGAKRLKHCNAGNLSDEVAKVAPWC